MKLEECYERENIKEPNKTEMETTINGLFKVVDKVFDKKVLQNEDSIIYSFYEVNVLTM